MTRLLLALSVPLLVGCAPREMPAVSTAEDLAGEIIEYSPREGVFCYIIAPRYRTGVAISCVGHPR